MVIVALAMGIGLIAALALGGRLARLADLRLSAPWLALTGAGAQLGGAMVAGAFGARAPYVVGSVLAAGLVVAFLGANRALHGIALVAAGLAVNAAVIVANAGMPVSAGAARRAGVGLAGVRAGDDPQRVLAGGGTALGWLGDRIPFPLPLAPAVVSVGDLCVASGLGLLVLTAMTTGARYDSPPPWRARRFR